MAGTGTDGKGGDRGGRPLVGLLWMVATGLLFVLVTVFVKMTGGRLPAAETAFLRYALGLPLLLPMLGSLRGSLIDRRTLMRFGFRGVAHSMAIICWFFAMTRIPIADVTALNYLAPIYVTIGAALFLGERLALRRIAAVAVAFVGALVILRPGFRELADGHLAMLAAGGFFGISYLTAKAASEEASASVVVIMLSVVVTVVLAPIAASVWVTPNWTELGLLFLVACCATLAHLSMTLAFQAAPVSVTQPATFLQLVWAALAGWLMFGEGVDSYVVAGGAMIVVALSYIAFRERQLARRVTPAPGAAAG